MCFLYCSLVQEVFRSSGDKWTSPPELLSVAMALPGRAHSKSHQHRGSLHPSGREVTGLICVGRYLKKGPFEAQRTEGEPLVSREVREFFDGAPNLSRVAQGLAFCALGSSLCLCWLEMLHPTVLFHLLFPEVTCNDLSGPLTCSSLTPWGFIAH